MIYVTVFETSSKKITTNSIDSKFESIEQVVNLQPGKHEFKNNRHVIYSCENNQSIVFSDFPFCTNE